MGNLALATLETVNIVPLADTPVFKVDTVQERAICQAISGITTLAILNKSVLHIYPGYSSHINHFVINVVAAKTDYHTDYDYMLNEMIDLSDDNALELLLQIEDSLIELIATEKDKLTGAV